jgi:hypothetical protein
VTLEKATEEEVLAGLLPLRIGGQRVTIPALPLKPGREWMAATAAAIEPIAGLQINTADWATLPSTFAASEEVMLGALLAYDRTHALGTREALEDRIFGPELGPAFNAMLQSVVPFDQAGMAQAGAAIPAVAASASPRSTNGASQHGRLSPELSSLDSPPGN